MNDQTRFVDSGYWIALLNQSDQHHARAVQLSRSPSRLLVTTEAVLAEVADRLADVRWRAQVADFIESAYEDPTLEIITVTRELFRRALERFKSRQDKDWGLTDCISFVVMEERGISEALAYDQHFIQAGFRALVREA